MERRRRVLAVLVGGAHSLTGLITVDVTVWSWSPTVTVRGTNFAARACA
jgi:hypothetical protein